MLLIELNWDVPICEVNMILTIKSVYDKNQFYSMELQIWEYAIQDIHAKYNSVGIDFLSIWFNSIWFDFGFSSNKAIEVRSQGTRATHWLALVLDPPL